MAYAGVPKTGLTDSDSDSSNEETKLSHLSTASSNSNESVASESSRQLRAVAFLSDVVRQRSTRNPAEHDESKSFLNAKSFYLCYSCYLQKR